MARSGAHVGSAPQRAGDAGDTARAAQAKGARARRGEAVGRIPDILNAAAAEFAERGFPGARMEDIAARVGVTKPVIYRYFKGKEALLEALIDRELMLDYSQITLEIRGHTGPVRPILNTVLAQVKRTVPGSADRLWVLRLMLADGHRMPQFRRALHASGLKPVREALAPVFLRAMAEGRMRSANPDFAAREVFAPFFQAIMMLTTSGLDHWRSRQTASYLDHAFDSFCRSYEIAE